jgi:hypothetical protein
MVVLVHVTKDKYYQKIIQLFILFFRIELTTIEQDQKMFSYHLLSAVYGATSITSFGAPSSLVQTLPYLAHIEHKHPTDPNLELEQIQVITRHGVRTPLSRYPHPYDKTEWQCDNLQEKIHDLLISRGGEPPVSYNQFEAEKSTY